MKTLQDLIASDLAGKRVLVRCDFNVPLDGGSVSDDGRIRAALPTLTALVKGGARVTVLAHLGRPKGVYEPKYSLAPVAERLAQLIDAPVKFATDTVGEVAMSENAALSDGEILLVENVRFAPGETSKDDAQRTELAANYAKLGDFFVSDGFGVVHRKQASVYDIAKLLPSYLGTLVGREVEVLSQITTNPARPFVVVLGGAKVADKLGVVDNLLKIADTIIIGGGMGYTFLKAQGGEIGLSMLDESKLADCRHYLDLADQLGKKIVLPVDARTVSEIDFENHSAGEVLVTPANAIPADREGCDIGPETEKLFAATIAGAKTVFWNGPVGVAEIASLASGTAAVAKAIAGVDGMTVIGGGDSAAIVRDLGYADDDFGWISTGGGASLEFMEGKELPGIAVLKENN